MSERQEKKAQFQQEKKRGLLPLLVGGLVVLAAAGVIGWKTVGSSSGGAKYQTVVAEGSTVTIPVAQVSDGKAHFFTYRSGDAHVDFFVLKSHDGVIRAAFDACDVCYHAKQGYRQDGDSMICNNCGMKFRSDMINEVKGGCNPAPIQRSVADGQLVIAAAELAQGGKYFPR